MKRKQISEVTNDSGQTFRIGGRVKRKGGNAWEGTVTKIDMGRPILIFVQPDDESQVPFPERYTLNPQAAAEHGKPTWCRSRDEGMTMGNFIPI